MEDYSDFVVHKSERAVHTDSIALTVDDLNNKLYDFQKDIVRWALAKGRAAIFADCGLGKTAMQLEWAHRVCVHTGGNALIVAPLTVSPQTVGEGMKFGVPVTLCETADDIQPGVNITNYEKLDKFAGAHFSAVVLDESSILKSFTGKVRNQIIDFFSDTPFRLACTATPRPMTSWNWAIMRSFWASCPTLRCCPCSLSMTAGRPPNGGSRATLRMFSGNGWVAGLWL